MQVNVLLYKYKSYNSLKKIIAKKSFIKKDFFTKILRNVIKLNLELMNKSKKVSNSRR